MRKGFILVEWMIQFLLCSLISLIAFTLFRSWSVRIHSLHRNLDASLQIPNAYHMICRDIHAAQPEMIEVVSDRCKIMISERLIVWRYKNNTLYRAQKKYDTKQKKWRRSVQSTTVENLPTCIFTPLYKKQDKNVLSGIRITCGAPVQEYVIGLRNGKEL